MFRSLPVADAAHREENLPPEARSYARDTVTLGWEERMKTRGRRRSDGGVEFGTALARGTVLRGGDCLLLDAIGLIIVVAEQKEPAFVITPATDAEWALFAYHIGNGHQPLMITATSLVCPERPGVEMLLQYHKIPFARAELAFTPATAAYGHPVMA